MCSDGSTGACFTRTGRSFFDDREWSDVEHVPADRYLRSELFERRVVSEFPYSYVTHLLVDELLGYSDM